MRGRLWILLVLVVTVVVSCGKPEKKEEKKETTTVDTTAAPATPPVTPISITVAYPQEGQIKPNVDSNFIFGFVSDRSAALTINGVSVPLARNGAFLAFLQMPSSGMYTLIASKGERSDTSTLYLKLPPANVSVGNPTEKAPPITYPQPLLGTVIRGSDTVETGSDAAPVSPTPTADRRWMLPNHAQVAITTKQNNLYKIAFDGKTEGWIADTSIQLSETPAPSAIKTIGRLSSQQGNGYVDIVLPVQNAPFLLDPSDKGFTLTVYGRKPPETGGTMPQQFANVQSLNWNKQDDNAQATVTLNKYLWGYKTFYSSDGSLVVRVRFAPLINPNDPLRGLTIVVDPGHPPAGAIGPTLLTEPEANLAISLRVANLLKQKGANVLITHTTVAGLKSSTNQAVELAARVEFAVNANADLLLSIHNNAFPDGTNPFTNYGTSTYYFHPFSGELARSLLREILPVTTLPNKNANQRSLALVRPTWMPSVLTESLYMMFPEQEMELRDSQFLDRLAEAHVRGLENFLRSKAQ